MKDRSKQVRRHYLAGVHIIWRVFLLTGLSLYLQVSSADELQTAAQIRQLTSDQATNHFPVDLKGVVTFYDRTNFLRFVQDHTAGIYLQFNGTVNEPPMVSGELVEVRGETDPGDFAPVVMVNHIDILGSTTNFPAAIPVSFEQIASGQEDSQFVEMHGIVRSAQYDDDVGYYLVQIAAGGGLLTAYARQLPVPSRNLVDSTVTVRGVVVSRFNGQRQLFDFRLLLPRPTDLVIDTATPVDPFAVPAQPIENLLQFTPHGPYGHRVKVTGTVIYQKDGNVLYIEDSTEGLYVETQQAGSLLPGDIVEVLGFPAKGEYTPMLQDAIFRKIGSGALPVPDAITTDEALKGNHDCRLVRIDGVILDRARHSQEQFLVLQAPGGFIFTADLERNGLGTDFMYLQNGTKVEVTGVCLIETGNSWQAGGAWRAKSFHILMRSAGDILILQKPPWWDLQKLLWIVGALIMVMLAAFAWVAILRRRVQKQTRIISQKLQTEAALKERYENLFENANDIVFTCDFHGRLTSINKTGEELLQFSREQIVGKNLVDFVAQEQRSAAAQWFSRATEKSNSSTVEWDFLDHSGQRIRLEIGTRIVRQSGEPGEVEGIARDITERKRLEKEILETSNREKQRIGHDLHDGVCQQLAGIAYRVDILVDQLQEKKINEAVEAERIGVLINDAITQTRGVARGLFPVRLEESGLPLALEDLVTNTCNLFKIKCDLICDEPGPALDNTMASHLYYIAQESVMNAGKHGQATQVTVSLQRAGDHYALSIRDNGTGLKPLNGSYTGMGIHIMHYRAKMIGATLDLKSVPGQGTEVTCTFYPARPVKKN
jgi:PAS domain S-box-containing protein